VTDVTTACGKLDSCRFGEVETTEDFFGECGDRGDVSQSSQIQSRERKVNVPFVPGLCPEGIVEIESQWTARRRERVGAVPVARAHPPAQNAGRVGQPQVENL